MGNFKNVNSKQSFLELEKEIQKFNNFLKLVLNKKVNNVILNFLKWFKIKFITFNKNSLRKFPKQGEIWNVRLGYNIGSEQNGEEQGGYVRPCLILKVFGVKIDNIIILPLTKSKKPDFVSFILEKNKYKYLKFEKSYILLDQVRSVSKKRLIGKPLGSISKEDFKMVKDKFISLFK